MTIADMKTLLSSITGLSKKVAYRAFPEAEIPNLPYVTFIDLPPVVFHADNVNYFTQPVYQVDLYELHRDAQVELAIEGALALAELTFNRTVAYLDNEKVWAVSYSVTTRGE